MKKLPIRMLTSICGPDFDLQPKQETDRFSVKEAIRLIDSGQAVPVNQADYETATWKPPESRAGAPRGRKGGAEVRALGKTIAAAVSRAVGRQQ